MPEHDREGAPAPRLADTATSWSAWAVRPDALPAVASAARSAQTADAATVQAYGGRDSGGADLVGGVAVIQLAGLIVPQPSLMSFLFGGGGYGLVAFRQQLRDALADDAVTAILLNVNSPGGRIDLVPEVAAEIRAARGTKPIVAIANTMAASAAYWLAAQADEVVVTPSGEVGSIGVFVLHYDYSGWDAQQGIRPTLIKAGKYKAEGHPDVPLSDEAKAAIQGTVDEYYGMFVADVAAGRGASEEDVRNGYAEGRMATAKRAVALGLADSVETIDEVVTRLARGGSQGRATALAPRAAEEEPPREAAQAPGLPKAEAPAAAAEAEAADEADIRASHDEPRGDQPEGMEADASASAEPTQEASDEQPASDEPAEDTTSAEDEQIAPLTADDRRRIAAVLIG